MTRRIERINEFLLREISLLLERQLKDPRLHSLISVTRIDTSKDLRHARVYISVLGDESTKAEALHGLSAATGYVKRHLGDVLPLKNIPSLTFTLDDSLEKGTAVLSAMNQLAAERPASGQEGKED